MEERSNDHSYEEIRQVVVNILAGREGRWDHGNQYDALKNAVAQFFEDREPRSVSTATLRGYHYAGRPSLSRNDASMLLEVFWGLFREGIITLGIDDSNRQFPWFRLSAFGAKVLEDQNPYFFHDVGTYESLIKNELPDIDDVTLIYLKEAMQAFKSGCRLSSSVMLGVATEHTFMKLLETIESNPTYQPTFNNAYRERGLLRRFNKFRNILDQNQNLLAPAVREDLETNFAGILTVIRTFRNESGHPSGKIIDREQCYVLLQLFIPYCKKIYQLIDTFKR